MERTKGMQKTIVPGRRVAALSLACAAAAALALSGGGVAYAAPTFTNASGYAHLVSVASGKCLDVITESALPGFGVDQLSCRSAASQEWALTARATITDHRTGGCGCTFTVYTVRNHNGGNCAQVPAGPVGDGTPVVQDTCDPDNTRQWWRLDQVGTQISAGGGHQIAVPVWSMQNYGVGMCLDVDNGSTADELPMQIWDCVDIDNQKWLGR